MDRNVLPWSKESCKVVFTVRLSQFTGSVELNFRGFSQESMVILIRQKIKQNLIAKKLDNIKVVIIQNREDCSFNYNNNPKVARERDVPLQVQSY